MTTPAMARVARWLIAHQWLVIAGWVLLAVAGGLAALALTTVPFLRSIGLAGMLIPLISIGVSATLLPVILDGIGPRLEWPRRRPARTASPLWTSIARGVVARPG
jgi:RND superfamily putative drug exporter